MNKEVTLKAWAFVAAALVMAVCTALGTVLLPVLSVTDIAMVYLVAVGLVASRCSTSSSCRHASRSRSRTSITW